MALIRQPVIENGRTWWKPVGNAAIGKCTHCCRAYAWKPGRGRTLGETHCPRCLGTLEQTSLALFRNTRWFSLDIHGERLTGHPLAPEVKSGAIDPWMLSDTQEIMAELANRRAGLRFLGHLCESRGISPTTDQQYAWRVDKIAALEARLAELEAR